MQRLYVEHVEKTTDREDWEVRLGEAFDRLMKRAAPDFSAPIRAVSAVPSNGLSEITVLVEDDPTGFRPLGT